MDSKRFIPFAPSRLPKNDPRYLKWLESLKKRPPVWNKGKTKETSQGVRKISETMRKKPKSNFYNWRQEMIKNGKIIQNYPPLKKTKKLALLIGLILGDGHVARFPRTERLSISLGTDKPDLIDFSFELVEEIFRKKPKVIQYKYCNAVRIYFYQRQISERLNISTGNRSKSKTGIPSWIWSSEEFLIQCVRGLFEAEGSLSIHKPTYTYNLSFRNKNVALLKDMKKALTTLGFHPETRPTAIRLRRKAEVKCFLELTQFRKYFAG